MINFLYNWWGRIISARQRNMQRKDPVRPLREWYRRREIERIIREYEDYVMRGFQVVPLRKDSDVTKEN